MLKQITAITEGNRLTFISYLISCCMFAVCYIMLTCSFFTVSLIMRGVVFPFRPYKAGPSTFGMSPLSSLGSFRLAQNWWTITWNHARVNIFHPFEKPHVKIHANSKQERSLFTETLGRQSAKLTELLGWEGKHLNSTIQWIVSLQPDLQLVAELWPWVWLPVAGLLLAFPSCEWLFSPGA